MGLAKLAASECAQQQTINHVVDTYPLTKSEGRWQSLHTVEDRHWLKTVVATALVKQFV